MICHRIQDQAALHCSRLLCNNGNPEVHFQGPRLGAQHHLFNFKQLHDTVTVSFSVSKTTSFRENPSASIILFSERPGFQQVARRLVLGLDDQAMAALGPAWQSASLPRSVSDCSIDPGLQA